MAVSFRVFWGLALVLKASRCCSNTSWCLAKQQNKIPNRWRTNKGCWNIFLITSYIVEWGMMAMWYVWFYMTLSAISSFWLECFFFLYKRKRCIKKSGHAGAHCLWTFQSSVFVRLLWTSCLWTLEGLRLVVRDWGGCCTRTFCCWGSQCFLMAMPANPHLSSYFSPRLGGLETEQACKDRDFFKEKIII